MDDIEGYHWYCTVIDTDGGWKQVAAFNEGSGHTGSSFTVDKSQIVANHAYEISFSVYRIEGDSAEGTRTERNFVIITPASAGTATPTITLKGSSTPRISEDVYFHIDAPQGTKSAILYTGDHWTTHTAGMWTESITYVVMKKIYKEAGVYTVQVLTSMERVEWNDWREHPVTAGNSMTITVTGEEGIFNEIE